MSNKATYRIDIFEGNTAPQRKSSQRPVVVSRNSNQKREAKIRRYSQLKIRAKVILVGILAITLSVAMLYSKVMLNEREFSIDKKKKELILLQSEHTRLANEVEHKVSYDYVTKYAEEQLGMMKMTASQIHYINNDYGNTVFIKDKEKGLLRKISDVIFSNETTEEANLESKPDQSEVKVKPDE